VKCVYYESINFVVPGGVHPGEVELLLSYKGHSVSQYHSGSWTSHCPYYRGNVTHRMGSNFGSTSGQRIRTTIKVCAWSAARPLNYWSVRWSILTIPTPRCSSGSSRAILPSMLRPGCDTSHSRSWRVQTGCHFPGERLFGSECSDGADNGSGRYGDTSSCKWSGSEPARLKVTITDATRAAVAPAENAPRILMIAPQRLGAGQAVMLALDYQRNARSRHLSNDVHGRTRKPRVT